MFEFIKKLLGTKADRVVKGYTEQVAEINAFAEQFRALSHDELRAKSLEFRAYIQDKIREVNDEIEENRAKAADLEDVFAKEDLFKLVDEAIKERDELIEEALKDILCEAFAVMKETARRFTENATIRVTATEQDRNLAAKGRSYVTIEGNEAVWKNYWQAAGGDIVWNMVHYDVQLIGGMVLHDGKIAEMGTGEGKTLVATLPAYLNGLTGYGVHIVTVNDYLARRDSEWVGPVFEFLMLSIDCIDRHRPNSNERRQAYKADIVYGTNNEFGFDYLRDNMVHSLDEMVQGKHHYAMVDEVDSVLIDDARTPLIISGPTYASTDDQMYMEMKPKVERLFEAQRQIATEQLALAKKLIEGGNAGADEGDGGLALFRSHRAHPKNRALIKFLSEEGMRTILQKTENFYLQEQQKHMHKADSALLFTIDEKNRQVELTEKGAEFMARGMDDKEFFVLPDITQSMMEIESNKELDTDTRLAQKELAAQEYSVKAHRLHTVQQLLKAYTLFEIDVEYVVMDEEVKIVDEQTGRIMDGRRYSDGLHQAIEAKENVKIGETTQTYATITLQNYFRMYHKLAGMTGTAETESSELWQIYKLEVVVIPTNRPVVRKDQDDLVFKTAREKYNAVIDEIEKLREAGRPTLVGTTSVELSELLSRLLKARNIPHNVLNAKNHQREAEIVSEAGLAGRVTLATNMAGRGTDIKLGEGVKDAGGLAIIGTERHDSRRVDRQLRGRAGRQGDPGSSQFYVSLEDNLMRLFQSDRIAKTMDALGHKEGDVIQHKMVTNSIERAQKKVEENNFGIRKRLLDYDDVMNIQRDAIYKKRYNAMSGERLSIDLNSMFESQVDYLVDAFHGGNYDKFQEASIAELGHDPDFTAEQFAMPREQFRNAFHQQVMDHYARKAKRIGDTLLPICADVKEREGDRFKRIAVPFTDGRSKGLNLAVDIDEALRTQGGSVIHDIEKTVTLAILDEEWKEHLRSMDDLKESVQSASFEQKDPLVIYKIEAYKLFEDLVNRINQSVTQYLMSGSLLLGNPNQQSQAPRGPVAPKVNKLSTNRSDDSELTESQKMQREALRQSAAGPQQAKGPVVNNDPKVGRNDACPCGSGKKYKHCHGK